MPLPKTRWARTRDGVDIAYEDFGQGTVTLVVIHGWISHLEVYWEQPRYERFMRRLSAGLRVLVFDKRGIGMSDRLTEAVDLETRMDDVGAVMDAAGVERAALLGWGTGGSAMAAFFAATHPERTVAILIDPFVQYRRKPDWPYGSTEEEFEADLQEELALWGEEVARGYDDPPDDPGFAAWDSRLGRFAATPASYEVFARTLFDTDVTDILPAIRVPTLVLAKEESAWANPDAAAFVAERIPDARAVTTPGIEGVVWVDEPEPFVAAIESFLGLEPPALTPDRVLSTVLFTDIVGSTVRAAELGDAAWKELLATHDERARTEIDRHRGRYVHTTGDGLLATFDGPARAVRCAQAICAAVQPLGVEIRAGCHTGEIELAGDDVSGIAVHIGARVAALANASEVLVSSTVKDLVAGAGLTFEDAGEHKLKGVPDTWHLYRVMNA